MNRLTMSITGKAMIIQVTEEVIGVSQVDMGAMEAMKDMVEAQAMAFLK